MKIAILAPVEEAIPPKKYGGIELVVYNLCQLLPAKGHEVSLFASGDSKTKAKLVPIFKKAVRTSLISGDDRTRDSIKQTAIGRIIEEMKGRKFDIIHNNFGLEILPFLSLFPCPTITTLHSPLGFPFQKIIFDKFGEYPLVSISMAQRRPFPKLNYIANIYNGIEVEKFKFSKKGGDYLAFLGRITPKKGPVEAIKSAQLSGKKLVIAAKVDPVDKEYFEKEVKPLIDGGQIKFIGEVGHKDKVKLLANAKALLTPINCEESFGLVMAESMACGTPVISFNRGSVPEVINDGQTGFICKKNTVSEMGKMIKKLYQIPEEEYLKMRVDSRKRVEDNFTAQKMADNYEKIYYKIIKNGK